MLIVQKYGGTSVGNSERIMNAAKKIINTYENGNSVVVVLSAQGDTTDELIKKAKEVNPKASKREMDMLLATGEQQSAALMAMAINSLGYPAISLNAQQIGIHSSSNHSNARIKSIRKTRINAELEKKNIVLITGFQGINKFGDITTLGRGGSDTTAVALSAFLGADLCEIYTDVDGVFTADPRIVKNAKKLDEISYNEMLELASLGAKVLHNSSVEFAKKHKVEVIVRSTFSDNAGTLVKEGVSMEKLFISGVAIDRSVAKITVFSVEDNARSIFNIFSILAKKNIAVDITLQSVGKDGMKDISFTVSREELEDALVALKESNDLLKFSDIVYNDKIAKLSVVGAGMAQNSGIASKMFEALYEIGVDIQLIVTSEIRLTVLIDEDDVERAANNVHDKFICTCEEDNF
ncbi:MAG: aspartate kinase [Defluviitaleaceae bacterium]|nr:aspartate kinase [Defluviitaleaceae bacterium]